MARQSFSGGGFIGKLGVHVGQRWHDTFMVRTWVKTPNPNTPAQKSHRQKFGLASSLASYAINANRFCGLFPVRIEGEHGSRLKCAFQKIELGLQGLSLYPLFPNNYTPPCVLEKCYLKSVSSSEIVFQIEGVLPATSRAMSALIALPATESDPAEDVITSGSLEIDGTSAVLTVANAWGDRVQIGQKIVLISNDDPAHESQTVWLPESEILEMQKPTRAFDLSVYSFTRANRTFTLVFEELYMEGSQTLSGVVVRCVYSGNWGEFSLENAVFENVDGRFALTFSAPGSSAFDLWAFPAGASISFGKIQVFGDDLNLISENVSQSLTSSDLTRSRVFQFTNANIFKNIVCGVALESPYSFGASFEIFIYQSDNVLFKGFEYSEEEGITDNTQWAGGYTIGEPVLIDGWGDTFSATSASDTFKDSVDYESTYYRYYATIEVSLGQDGVSGETYTIQNPNKKINLNCTLNGVQYGMEIDFRGYAFVN